MIIAVLLTKQKLKIAAFERNFQISPLVGRCGASGAVRAFIVPPILRREQVVSACRQKISISCH
jgi:hypothetical protein